jgi:radical SAM superfamily enzyme YgiQ (UPF0313 family)
VRAEHILRDAASGALAACVAAGLNEVYIGIERPDREGLRALEKESQNGWAAEAVRILSEKHPEVFTVGSFIYGLPGDTPETIQAIHRHAAELGLDMSFYIPLTPLPGTPYWRSEQWDPTGASFRSFDFLPHVNGDPAVARLTWALYRNILFSRPGARLRWVLRGFFSRNKRRRSIIRRHAARGVQFTIRALRQGLTPRDAALSMRFPKWYND